MIIQEKITRTFVVTEKVYKGFLDLFEDSNPLHTNIDFAKKFGFDQEVMYGNILNGFLSHFVGECLPLKNVVILSQTIKFLKPVYLSDSLEFEAEQVNFFESVKMMDFKFKFINKDRNLNIAKGTIQVGILS